MEKSATETQLHASFLDTASFLELRDRLADARWRVKQQRFCEEV